MPSLLERVPAALAGVSSLILVSGVCPAEALTRVTCRGEFGTGSGLAGSYIGNKCLLAPDTDEERAVHRVCEQNGQCTVVGMADQRSGKWLIRKVVSVVKADSRAAASEGESLVREVLARVLSPVLTVKEKTGDDRRFLTPELYALFMKNAREFNGDPYTGSQEPESYRLVSLSSEARDAAKVIVTAHFDIQGLPDAHPRIAYVLVRDSDRWRIDDIRYVSEGDTSMRRLMRGQGQSAQ